MLGLVVRPRLVPLFTRHLHGEENLETSSNDVVLICVVRNGERYIESFIRHYRGLGIRHMVFLDNGSTDGTIQRLQQYPDVTLLQCNRRYDQYENAMKTYLASRFCKERWALCVDIDEFWDYPFSDLVPLPELIRYLQAQRFTAVIGQMLDMFADAPLSQELTTQEQPISDRYPFYDISSVSKSTYPHGDTSIPLHRGGIRYALFGTYNGLTKVVLFKMSSPLRPFVSWHHVRGGRIADFSTVLKHYPFTGQFRSKVEDAVRTGRYGAAVTNEYRGYWNGLQADEALNPRLPTARLYRDVNLLIEENFLQVSGDFLGWVGRHSCMTRPD
jgi:glycosyltransferase involved in cell wall biosynthesis